MKNLVRLTLTAIFVVACIFSATTAQAIGRVANEREILADMYAHPANYIRYGGASIGLSFLIARNSLNVELYNPPNYIISARRITHHNGITKESIEGDDIIRYKYDFAAKKMYMEKQDQNKNVSWEYLEPADNKSYHYDNLVAAGEFLFYIAYNMSFYDKPAMYSFQKFVNEGLTGLPMINLGNNGDSTIWHFYNHKTGQIEWWKPVYNKKTKNNEWVRVK